MLHLRPIGDHKPAELLPTLPATVLEGAKGGGKEETALQRAAAVRRLGVPVQ